FQAEDGIRDFHVTGVQTCALPIFALAVHVLRRRGRPGYAGPGGVARPLALAIALFGVQVMLGAITVWLELSATVTALHFVTAARSEERRVGKESRWRAVALEA